MVSPFLLSNVDYRCSTLPIQIKPILNSSPNRLDGKAWVAGIFQGYVQQFPVVFHAKLPLFYFCKVELKL